MKKLILTVMIAGAAVFSAQAAKCYWGFRSLTTGDADKFADAADLRNYTAYLVTDYNWSTYGVDGLGTYSAVSKGVTSTYAKPNAVFQVTSTLTAPLTHLEKSATESYDVGDLANFYLVITDGATKYAAFETSATLMADTDTTKSTPEITTFIDSFGGKAYISNGVMQSIPEPTSGLLLLLGVAGLALRRKHA